MTVDELKTYLQQVAAIGTKCREHLTEFTSKSIEEFVLKHGQEYKPQPLPRIFKPGLPRHCYENAYHLAVKKREFIYVEGYCLSPGSIPLLHAWCADVEGNVYDPTYTGGPNPPLGEIYFGVPFAFPYVQKTVLHNRCYGLLDDFQNKFPLLRTTSKEWWRNPARVPYH
jgi:hypothetical protein